MRHGVYALYDIIINKTAQLTENITYILRWFNNVQLRKQRW